MTPDEITPSHDEERDSGPRPPSGAADREATLYLTDDELIERGFARILELHSLRRRAQRIGVTVNVRVASGSDGRERYIYCIQGGNREDAPTAAVTLEEAMRDVSDLESRYISERID
jgi:hypothetical protein